MTSLETASERETASALPSLALQPALVDLRGLLEAHRASYRAAKPFPHVSIDNMVSDGLLDEVVREFPTVGDARLTAMEEAYQSHSKFILPDVDSPYGPATRYLFSAFASSSFISFLEQLTGISGLIPDPHLHAAGLHQYQTGGFLGIHSDFHWNNRLHLYRRVNLLVYLNRDWPEEYGGHLELWDGKMRECVKYLPTWNRAVIHNVTARAYHGVTTRVNCPKERTRKSLAVWYYTSKLPQRDEIEYKVHHPDWAVPGAKSQKRVKSRLSQTLRLLVPPIARELVTNPRATLGAFAPPLLAYGLMKMAKGSKGAPRS